MIQGTAVRPRPAAKHIRTRAALAPRSIPRQEEAVVTFLADVLVSDTPWRLTEVQSLLALHTLVAVGRWHAAGLDDACFPAE